MASKKCGLFNALQRFYADKGSDDDDKKEEPIDTNLESEYSDTEDSAADEPYVSEFFPKNKENGIDVNKAIRELSDTVVINVKVVYMFHEIPYFS